MNQQITNLMTSAATSSAQIIKNNFRKTDDFKNKSSHIDIVTPTDVLSQQNIRKVLVEGMVSLGYAETDIGFVEEESKVDVLKKYNFIVDPLDGTSNFSSGIPYCCVSIGFAVDQVLVAGVVADPFLDTVYCGVLGEGSFVKKAGEEKRQLLLSNKSMSSWMVSAHYNGLDKVHDQFSCYERIYPSVRGLRNLGSLTLDLCLLADNVFDVVLNKGCYFWDLAAASVILKEAGGQLFDYNGAPLAFDWNDSKKKYLVVGCRPDAVSDVLSFTN